jgi:hypothetical protein
MADISALMILATKLELGSAQADIMAAFVHAELDEDKRIYVHQAAGFKREGNLVYKLCRSIYGLHRSNKTVTMKESQYRLIFFYR